jgi:hypothetical protein
MTKQNDQMVLRVGARVGVYRKCDGEPCAEHPVVTILGQRGAYLTTSQGALLDPQTGVFFGDTYVAGAYPRDFATGAQDER